MISILHLQPNFATLKLRWWPYVVSFFALLLEFQHLLLHVTTSFIEGCRLCRHRRAELNTIDCFCHYHTIPDASSLCQTKPILEFHWLEPMSWLANTCHKSYHGWRHGWYIWRVDGWPQWRTAKANADDASAGPSPWHHCLCACWLFPVIESSSFTQSHSFILRDTFKNIASKL